MMLQNIMENYLNSKTIDIYPVSDKKLKKVFKFENRKQKESFIIEIIKYIREAEAEIEMRIKNQRVAIILHALSPELSEIEFEAKEDIDKIRKDVVYYFAKKE